MMLYQAVLGHGFLMDYLYLNRAKFALFAFQGDTVPFFKQLKSISKTAKTSLTHKIMV